MQRYYAYQCAPSTEVRGRRADHDKGCGLWAVRASNTNLNDHSKRNSIQSRPCKSLCGCTKRQRLSAKNTWEAPIEDSWVHQGGVPMYPDLEARKAWAYQKVKEMNEQVSIAKKNAQQNVTTSPEDVSTIPDDVSTIPEKVSA